jgi:hypothetical protein
MTLEPGSQELVNKVSDLREDGITQLYAQQPRTERATQAQFKGLEDGSRQIRLLPEHQ